MDIPDETDVRFDANCRRWSDGIGGQRRRGDAKRKQPVDRGSEFEATARLLANGECQLRSTSTALSRARCSRERDHAREMIRARRDRIPTPSGGIRNPAPEDPIPDERGSRAGGPPRACAPPTCKCRECRTEDDGTRGCGDSG